MAVPILKQGDYLIASIQAALSDNDILELQDDLVERVGRFRSRGIIVDVTALDVMDSFASRSLRGLEDVHTALDLEEGLAFLDMQTKEQADGER
jgi:rsbT antagonist protein RsbS